MIHSYPPRTCLRRQADCDLVQMHPSDARREWLGDRIPGDLFALYCFDAPATPVADVLDELRSRAAVMGELQVRMVEVPAGLDYPYWAAHTPAEDRFVVHESGSYEQMLVALSGLVATRVDVTVSPWRLHVFPHVTGAPRGNGPALVVVLQMSHAFADGVRTSALARDLLAGTATPTTPPRVLSPAGMLTRAVLRLPFSIPRVIADGRRSVDAARQLADPSVPPPTPGRPLVAVNTAPGPRRTVRTLVFDSVALRSVGTVTIGALTAIGAALSQFLGVDELSAEVPVAVAPGTARNSYRNVGVDLHCALRDPHERAAAIAADLALQRIRARHPAMAIRVRTDDHVPAPLLRFGTDRLDLSVVPPTVTGNTVVSSVYRGPADLELGGGRVRFTSGFPGLSPVQALTHGVHGIGDTVTLSVTTSPDVLDAAGLARYVSLLHEAVASL
ncbi:WS/DGAT domain-containing protein [Rhodococcus pyridinivorans]|uniref:wax ester/triacylglycerol synthase domain-containing protein n=1 Tax=Rhodococcus pyridinivorans TaxID=103816 RepID=UPI000EAD2CAE|nr:wax ester/triacylglycerol synthase domain-containing protein [Rhodococcus pyridinivorans]MCW3471893.1 WS/DGAT domain-containing protein [Rhodococcus pyridinivorans]